MNKNLDRAIDFLIHEDADVINELEAGVFQMTLQAVACTLDMDPYELLAKVWDRYWIKIKPDCETKQYHVVTDRGVFAIRWVQFVQKWETRLIHSASGRSSLFGVFGTKQDAFEAATDPKMAELLFSLM